MNEYLLALALSMQLADTVSTCNRLHQGYRELNPLLGQTCTSVATRKALIIGGSYLLSPKKYRDLFSISFSVTGGIGFTINITR